MMPGGRPSIVSSTNVPVSVRPCRFTFGARKRKGLAWRELSGYKCRRYKCVKSNYGQGNCGGRKGYVRRCADFGRRKRR
jgi:hypothetical protein